MEDLESGRESFAWTILCRTTDAEIKTLLVVDCLLKLERSVIDWRSGMEVLQPSVM